MPSKKAKKLNKLPREKVLLEPCRRLTNSIRAFFKTELGPKRSRAGTTPLFETTYTGLDKHQFDAKMMTIRCLERIDSARKE